MEEYSGQKPVWIKTVQCAPYTLIFNNPSETHDVEYDIIDKTGKHVGILRNSQGLFLFYYFFFIYICKYAFCIQYLFILFN